MSNSQVSSQDKRRSRRLPCALEVAKDLKSGSIGMVTDITLDGASITTDIPMPAGLIMPLIITIDENTEVKADVEVVRSSAGVIGVRFLNLSPKDSRRLRRHVVDLSDAVGAKESALKLLDTDGRITRPIKNAAAIRKILSNEKGRYFLFPSERSVRVEAVVTKIDGNKVALNTKSKSKFVRNEAVVCLFSHEFVSFSFRSRVVDVLDDVMTVSFPEELCYSERRSSPRGSLSGLSTVKIKAKMAGDKDATFPLIDKSEGGFSFRVPASQHQFSVGETIAEIVVSVEGDDTVVRDASVRNVTPVVDEAGKPWTRIGVSRHVQRSVHAESQEMLEAQRRGLLGKFVNVGRNIQTKISYAYHSKKKTKGAMGHAVVQFTNRSKQPMTGLLDTTFDLSNRRVRAPVFLIVPGYGQRKETMSALAHVITHNWKKKNRDIAVFRFDGTNNLGESYKDSDCQEEGKHCLHYNIPGAVDDLSGALDWVKNNKHVDPTSITVFSISMGSAAVRRFLTRSESAIIQNWISFMGAADVANAIMHGSGHIDIVGNFEKGIKTGVIAVIGCLIDADHFCNVTAPARLLSIDHARDDMARVKANITWFIGKHDAYIDPRRVRDLMSVAAVGKREIIEVDAGHVPRHGDEALSEFSLVAKRVWRYLYGSDISPAIPSRGWIATCEKREWDRVRQGMKVDKRSWWKDYLVGDDELGFDVWSYTPEYRELVGHQSAMVCETQPRKVLDLGAGTGNMSEALLAAGVPEVVAADLVPEALERIKKKVDRKTGSVERLRTVPVNADGSPLVALRRWIAGDLGPLSTLSRRLHPDLGEQLAKIGEHYSPELHSVLRGAPLDVEHIALKNGVPDACVPALRELSQVSRIVRQLTDSPAEVNSVSLAAMIHASRGLPFEDGSFDSVVCSLVLSYMDHPDDTLYEMHRVLKPYGRVVVSSMLPDMDSSKSYLGAIDYVETADASDLPYGMEREKLLEALRRFSDKSSKLVHLEEEGSFEFFSGTQLKAMLECAGFEDVAIRLSCGTPALAVIATGTKR